MECFSWIMVEKPNRSFASVRIFFIKIEMPSGYYIVTEEYIIEIAFDAAPVFR